MKWSAPAALSVFVLGAGVLSALPSASAAPAPAERSHHLGASAAQSTLAKPPQSSSRINVYTATMAVKNLASVRSLGLDRESLTIRPGPGDQVRAVMVISPLQATRLRGMGVDVRLRKVSGLSAAKSSTLAAKAAHTVFHSFSEPGGIRDELHKVAANHPRLTKLVKTGESLRGKPILAIRVTKGANRLRDGKRPSVLYMSAQHAREWITPEMTTRLLHYMVGGYAHRPRIHRLLSTTELWFLPVANPDGYDYTFTPGHRLWRKNLRDNNHDGHITAGDGVDPNRNFPTQWGYDDEGSSSDPSSETYRGTAPASEPETRAVERLLSRVGFEFVVNYHSAAELLLYGVGWQVATPTPDDLILQAMAGDDDNSAIPGYDPDLSAELYTTNGETDDNAQNAHGALAFTPEMSTCQTVSAIDPDDPFDPADCPSSFNFPDSEPLVEDEFEKNIPFALSVAESAHHPDHPESVVGRHVPDFQTDPFAYSYGDPQPVAVWARRSLAHLRMRYSIDGGPVHTSFAPEWNGGERYGDSGVVYFAEHRGTVRGADVGDKVKVWFTATRHGGGATRSDSFTYTLLADPHARVLIVANEDYTGFNPDYPESVGAPKYAFRYQRALRRAGLHSAVWDVDQLGVPHHLGVLGHFDAVVWYLGDNRLTQDEEDQVTETPFGDFTDAAVSEDQQYLTMAVRDYLNEGGKLLYTGETAAYYGSLGGTLGGIYYGLDSDPSQDCVVTVDIFSDCLLLSDDFTQYYLGTYNRSAIAGVAAYGGTGRPLGGLTGTFGGSVANPVDEAGALFVTSDFLPPSMFPLFRSSASSEYLSANGRGPFDPTEGDWYVAGSHADDSYMRLVRTIDLTGVTAGDEPSLQFDLNFDTEPGYDNVILEAHTVGQDDWTTLPEAGGLTDQELPSECDAGFLLEEHPWLEHYITPGPPCAPTGTTGAWNRATGNSGGFQSVTYDLSAYAGSQVEVSISYVTDPFTGGVGVFVDNTRVVAGGNVLSAEGFETGLGPWSIPGAPAGSPGNVGDFQRSQAFIEVAASTTTRDSLLLGFGVEQLGDPDDRTAILRRAMRYLL